MITYVYMVRHGDSPKSGSDERSRGLSAKGKADVKKVTGCLRDEGINVFYSSPYARAVLTIAGLAEEQGQEIQLVEDLKERLWTDSDQRPADRDLYPYLEKMLEDPDFILPGGESGRACQTRAVHTLQEILHKHPGGRIAIGTHGMVMTLMMNYFAADYGYEFLMQLSKPDIYRLEFTDGTLRAVERIGEFT